MLGLQSHQIKGQGQLQGENYRNAQGEFDMFGLMANGVHPNETAYAAAQGGNAHEGCFGNPPEAPAGFVLVRKHKDEADGIDYKQVQI